MAMAAAVDGQVLRTMVSMMDSLASNGEKFANAPNAKNMTPWVFSQQEAMVAVKMSRDSFLAINKLGIQADSQGPLGHLLASQILPISDRGFRLNGGVYGRVAAGMQGIFSELKAVLTGFQKSLG